MSFVVVTFRECIYLYIQRDWTSHILPLTNICNNHRFIMAALWTSPSVLQSVIPTHMHNKSCGCLFLQDRWNVNGLQLKMITTSAFLFYPTSLKWIYIYRYILTAMLDLCRMSRPSDCQKAWVTCRMSHPSDCQKGELLGRVTISACCRVF